MIRAAGESVREGKRFKEGKEMVRWSYGVGEEGIRIAGPVGGKTFIVDQLYPCWWSAAKSVGLNVSSVWFQSENSSLLDYIKTLMGDVEISLGPTLSDSSWSKIRECEWILIGGVFPPDLNNDQLWSSPKLARILVTSMINFSLPKGWELARHIVTHAEVGGVTDGCYKILSIARVCVEAVISYDKTPGQDLRAILKTGESGVQSMNMTLPPRIEAACSVKYCGSGVIEEASLWPCHSPNVKVRTKWRNTFWIERRLVSFERLLAMDVSEKLIRIVPDGKDRWDLINRVHTPGKVLYAVLLHSQREGLKSQIHRRRKREEVDEGRIIKRSRLETALPKLERVPYLIGGNSSDEGHGTGETRGKLRIDPVRWATSLPAIMEEESVERNGLVSQEVGYNDKATKNDSSEVRYELWDNHLLSGLDAVVRKRDLKSACNKLRAWLLRWWKRKVTQSYFHWMKQKGGQTYHEEAKDCISRAANSTWWAWDDGSRPFFWRWPEEHLTRIRDGAPVWFEGSVTPWTRKQKGTSESSRSDLIRQKLMTVRDKRYVDSGSIISLMSYFDVPKGSDDIRMVYDGSASGLNGLLWAPWFSLPNSACLLRALEPGYSMSDNDVGEMFHNFMLNEDLRRFCGLDFSPYFRDNPMHFDSKNRYWLRWNRLAMGLRPSPYCAVQSMMVAREVILGEKHDQVGNVFHWDHVRLNLPGSIRYEPSRAWVTKVRENGEVAADVFIYVDDIRCSAPTQLEAWKASQRTSSILGNLGIQDAARKRRDPGQETGAWTGSVVWTSHGKIIVKTTQEKWDKVKMHLEWISNNMDNKGGLENKRLQSIRGFLVYVSQTYGSMVPYLKGLHSTIDSWRSGRSPSGWKISKNKQSQTQVRDDKGEFYDWDDRFGLTPVSENEPQYVFPVPRFRNDVQCLLSLTAASAPPNRMGRMSKQAKVMYGFGDASKHGFGASIELPDKSIVWRYGQWRLEEEYDRLNPNVGLSFMEERSSNYRELRNLVEALESAHHDGLLTDREIFMFTDNSTAEAAFFKGTSSSELLFELVLRLRKIEMKGDCIIHMIHVAGTRMIHQGTDGLSRGDKTSGVMAGENMLSFIPLHLSALDRSPGIKSWIESIFEKDGETGEELIFMEPSDWPEPLVCRANYIWMPPPAAADVAAEYMAQSIHKRSHSTHIFICPRLMTSRWQRIVRKSSDLYLTIPLGSEMWTIDQHEPLILAISFPLSREKPWRHGATGRCIHVGKILPGLLKEDTSGAIAVLRECFARAWGMAQL